MVLDHRSFWPPLPYPKHTEEIRYKPPLKLMASGYRPAGSRVQEGRTSSYTLVWMDGRPRRLAISFLCAAAFFVLARLGSSRLIPTVSTAKLKSAETAYIANCGAPRTSQAPRTHSCACNRQAHTADRSGRVDAPPAR